jgi:radical SAM protein with 4Fe4S-binding SPASM domain
MTIDEETTCDIKKMLEVLKTVDKSPYFYPREPTTPSALRLLPEYKNVGMDSILTNGKTLTQPRVIDALKRAGIKSLTVTVPGEAKSYAIYTKEPMEQYEKILEGISIAKQNGFDVSAFTPVFEENINDIIPMVDRLSKLGVSTVRFIRVVPVGNAKDMPNDFFLKPESTIRFLKEVNRARLLYPSVKLSLFGQSFGPNFYSPGIWRALAGQTKEWPGTKFACPAINRRYLGVVLGSNEIVSCFEGMSLENQKIGFVRDGKLILDSNTSRSEEVLQNNLRGICSKNECEYQALCMGGCRTAAMSEAIRRNEPEPEFAGQTI